MAKCAEQFSKFIRRGGAICIMDTLLDKFVLKTHLTHTIPYTIGILFPKCFTL